LAEFPHRLRDQQQERTRWNQLACSECGCAGFQSGCMVVVTRDGKQRGSVWLLHLGRRWFVLFVIEKLEPLPHGCAFHSFAFRVSGAIPVPQPKPGTAKGLSRRHACVWVSWGLCFCEGK